eukprot:ANDGO_04025.mRNA.1 hypothetical protein
MNTTGSNSSFPWYGHANNGVAENANAPNAGSSSTSGSLFPLIKPTNAPAAGSSKNHHGVVHLHRRDSLVSIKTGSSLHNSTPPSQHNPPHHSHHHNQHHNQQQPPYHQHHLPQQPQQPHHQHHHQHHYHHRHYRTKDVQQSPESKAQAVLDLQRVLEKIEPAEFDRFCAGSRGSASAHGTRRASRGVVNVYASPDGRLRSSSAHASRRKHRAKAVPKEYENCSGNGSNGGCNNNNNNHTGFIDDDDNNNSRKNDNTGGGGGGIIHSAVEQEMHLNRIADSAILSDSASHSTSKQAQQQGNRRSDALHKDSPKHTSHLRKGAISESGVVYYDDDDGGQQVIFSFTDTWDINNDKCHEDESDLGPRPVMCPRCSKQFPSDRIKNHSEKCSMAVSKVHVHGKKKQELLRRCNSQKPLFPSIAPPKDADLGDHVLVSESFKKQQHPPGANRISPDAHRSAKVAAVVAVQCQQSSTDHPSPSKLAHQLPASNVRIEGFGSTIRSSQKDVSPTQKVPRKAAAMNMPQKDLRQSNASPTPLGCQSLELNSASDQIMVRGKRHQERPRYGQRI